MRERRRAHRYELYMPLQVLIAASHFPDSQSAHLRDISTHGVYFVSAGSIAPGTALDISFTLPQEQGRRKDVVVRGSGRSLRLDRVPNEDGPMYGVAASIDRFDFVYPDRRVA
jgi:PilZ domain